MKDRGLTPEEIRCREEDPGFHVTFARAVARSRGLKERAGGPDEIRSDDDFAAHLERIQERVGRFRGLRAVK
jgi:hypothetical protein